MDIYIYIYIYEQSYVTIYVTGAYNCAGHLRLAMLLNPSTLREPRSSWASPSWQTDLDDRLGFTGLAGKITGKPHVQW